MNAAACDRPNPDLRAKQCCKECGPDSITRWCPQFRLLSNQGRDHGEWSYVANQCANTDCRVPLCDDHLCPAGRAFADTRLRFCSECHKARAHCTTCGIGGVDAYSSTNQETAGKGRFVPKDLSLWPCNPAPGCFNYLCRKCGASHDGCSLHQRLFNCAKWYEHWGARNWDGLLGRYATSTTLTPEREAYMQQQLLAICDDPRANPATEAAMPNAAAQGGVTPLPAGPTADLHYDPGTVPQPVLLPGGYTLYPGETTVGRIPSSICTLPPPRPQQCQHGPTLPRRPICLARTRTGPLLSQTRRAQLLQTHARQVTRSSTGRDTSTINQAASGSATPLHLRATDGRCLSSTALPATPRSRPPLRQLKPIEQSRRPTASSKRRWKPATGLHRKPTQLPARPSTTRGMQRSKQMPPKRRRRNFARSPARHTLATNLTRIQGHSERRP